VKNLEVVTQMRYTTYGAGFPDAPATLEQGLRRTRVLWVSDPQVSLFPRTGEVKQMARTCRPAECCGIAEVEPVPTRFLVTPAANCGFPIPGVVPPRTDESNQTRTAGAAGAPLQTPDHG
jgi:hypothetical protein